MARTSKPPSVRPSARLHRRTPVLLPDPRAGLSSQQFPAGRVSPTAGQLGQHLPQLERRRISPIDAARARVEAARLERESQREFVAPATAPATMKPASLRVIEEQNVLLAEIRDAIRAMHRDLLQLGTDAGSEPTVDAAHEDDEDSQGSDASASHVSDVASISGGDPIDASA